MPRIPGLLCSAWKNGPLPSPLTAACPVAAFPRRRRDRPRGRRSGLILWLALEGRGRSSSTVEPNATAASAAELESLAASRRPSDLLGRAEAGLHLRADARRTGTINVRYLPSGRRRRHREPYLTVATYPFPNAYAALKGIKAKDVVFVKIPKGGIAEYTQEVPAERPRRVPGRRLPDRGLRPDARHRDRRCSSRASWPRSASSKPSRAADRPEADRASSPAELKALADVARPSDLLGRPEERLHVRADAARRAARSSSATCRPESRSARRSRT